MKPNWKLYSWDCTQSVLGHVHSVGPKPSNGSPWKGMCSVMECSALQPSSPCADVHLGWCTWWKPVGCQNLLLLVQYGSVCWLVGSVQISALLQGDCQWFQITDTRFAYTFIWSPCCWICTGCSLFHDFIQLYPDFIQLGIPTQKWAGTHIQGRACNLVTEVPHLLVSLWDGFFYGSTTPLLYRYYSSLIKSLFCVGKEVTEARGKPFWVITDFICFINLLIFVIPPKFAVSYLE